MSAPTFTKDELAEARSALCANRDRLRDLLREANARKDAPSLRNGLKARISVINSAINKVIVSW
jgi:hypothetical protein